MAVEQREQGYSDTFSTTPEALKEFILTEDKEGKGKAAYIHHVNSLTGAQLGAKYLGESEKATIISSIITAVQEQFPEYEQARQANSDAIASATK